MHVPKFGGLSGSEDRGGGDNSIQFINFGRWVTKILKNGNKKYEGGRVGDNAPAESSNEILPGVDLQILLLIE